MVKDNDFGILSRIYLLLSYSDISIQERHTRCLGQGMSRNSGSGGEPLSALFVPQKRCLYKISTPQLRMKPAGCWATLFSKSYITLLLLVLIGFDLQDVFLIRFRELRLSFEET